MLVPSTYHKSVEQRHHELNHKVFIMINQNVPSRTVALHQIFCRITLAKHQMA